MGERGVQVDLVMSGVTSLGLRVRTRRLTIFVRALDKTICRYPNVFLEGSEQRNGVAVVGPFGRLSSRNCPRQLA